MPVRLPEGSAGAPTAGQRRALEAFYAVLNDHDVDLLDQAAAPDWEDISPAPGQGSGPAGAKPIFRMLVSALPDFSVEILEVVAGPGRAAVRARNTSRRAVRRGGNRPPGQPCATRIPSIRGQPLRRTWHMEDLFGLFAQIGSWPVMPDEAAPPPPSVSAQCRGRIGWAFPVCRIPQLAQDIEGQFADMNGADSDSPLVIYQHLTTRASPLWPTQLGTARQRYWLNPNSYRGEFCATCTS
jgi:hypothetical protein